VTFLVEFPAGLSEYKREYDKTRDYELKMTLGVSSRLTIPLSTWMLRVIVVVTVMRDSPSSLNLNS